MTCAGRSPRKSRKMRNSKVNVMRWLDKIPLYMLLIAALTLGLAPFVPQPHLLEKLQMLADGTLSRPIDIFDLLLHGTPFVLLLLKLLRMYTRRTETSPPAP
jgi:hypothetical protein